VNLSKKVKFAIFSVVLVSMVYLWYGCEYVPEIPPGKEITIVCRIYDSLSLQLLGNCTVTVTSPEGSVSVYRSPDGKLEIGDIVQGIYEIKASKNGFTEMSEQVVVFPRECATCTACYIADFYLTQLSEPQVIGPAGGTINMPNGAKVVIPAGVLSTQSAISATYIPAIGLPGLPADDLCALGGLDLRPDGLVFHAPITLTIPVDSKLVVEGATVFLYFFDPVSRKWINPVAAQLNTARTLATVQISHFSGFGIYTKIKAQIAGPPYSTGWKDLTISPCGEAGASVTYEFKVEGNLSGGVDVGLVATGTLGVSMSFSLTQPGCSAKEGYRRTLRVRYKRQNYIISGYDKWNDIWIDIGVLSVPQLPIDFDCKDTKCHEQGGG